jgi:hypothetical protein
MHAPRRGCRPDPVYMAITRRDVLRRVGGKGSVEISARILLIPWLLLVYLKSAAADTAFVLPPATITFDGQTGVYGTIYPGHTEGAFTITPTAGVWYESSQYGSPTPSIYTGPPGVPQHSGIRITSAAGLFSFGSLDFSSNNGPTTYSIQGHLGAILQFQQFGMLQNPGPGFETLWSDYSGLPLDALLIDVTPGEGTTSFNLDNVTLPTLVPEPGALGLLAVALGAFVFLRLRR